MRIFLFLSLFLIAASVQAERYTFGPKAGEEIPLEEEKIQDRQEVMIQKLISLEELTKQNQALMVKQNQLLEQQNQLLNQMYQFQYQSAVPPQLQYAPPVAAQPAPVPAQ